MHQPAMSCSYSMMGRNRASISNFSAKEIDIHMLGLHSVEIMEDTKIPNAATIKILKQDHTLGNMIRAYVSFPNSIFNG
jgi:hypothetical protein